MRKHSLKCFKPLLWEHNKTMCEWTCWCFGKGHRRAAVCQPSVLGTVCAYIGCSRTLTFLHLSLNSKPGPVNELSESKSAVNGLAYTLAVQLSVPCTRGSRDHDLPSAANTVVFHFFPVCGVGGWGRVDVFYLKAQVNSCPPQRRAVADSCKPGRVAA